MFPTLVTGKIKRDAGFMVNYLFSSFSLVKTRIKSIPTQKPRKLNIYNLLKYLMISLLCLLLVKARIKIDSIAWNRRNNCPVGWGCRIHRLLLCRGVRQPPHECPGYMTLNNLMVRFQQCWSFGECGVPLHCHRSQVHSGPEW